MTRRPFTELRYEGEDRQVKWSGVKLSGDDRFVELMEIDVAERIRDGEGARVFEDHLRGLASTGFELTHLESILKAIPTEDRDWAVGEALAEVYLAREHDVQWPWNSERDKRNPAASLPGADLVGLMEDDLGSLLALGEVKCSSEGKNPPQVMTGRSGMIHQLDKIVNDLSILGTLLKWLFPRCKGSEWETRFNDAVRRLLGSENRAVHLFGVLIRDTEPDEKDLVNRGRALADKLREPTLCALTALHIPCAINDLPNHASGFRR